MRYLIFREVECLDVDAFMSAMPLVAKIVHAWGKQAPEMPLRVMRPALGGHPTRFRWLLEADSLDSVQAAMDALFQNQEYVATLKQLGELVDNTTWYDDSWRELPTSLAP